ncbi:nuclear transport factor 2 family protein [Salinigranum halophilum]|jgi:ketosteroid isomerase-like protein|uniref:nuclear transport factor 2 family protein n=1 Tax=Salinigranum halophilum TaxID=2565931 RepID=UPI0010A86453|nr:nuclear transport factor 2 family protein [Salinigranum halophilum]
MVPLDHGTFRTWLDEYTTAWETGDADAAAALFASDATYHETPFTDPLDGRDAIRTYWAQTTATQEATDVDTTIEAINRATGLAQFETTFVRDGSLVTVEGVLSARFVAGDCVEFREWWHRKG